MAKIDRAVISVSDKTGVVEFAQRLAALGVSIVSTGGTARLLRESDVEVQDVADYTGFPEILDGRVKTLHPKVHGGLLAERGRDTHILEMKEHGIEPIDMVVVNLYPFVDVISEPGVGLVQAIENIDIGGPTMVRGAAKNYTHVAVVTNPGMYDSIAEELEQNGGCLSQETHFDLAVEAFRHTAHYDNAIAEYLSGIEGEHTTGPERLALEFVKKQDLRYGENPQQTAAFYVEEHVEEPCVGTAEQIAGPELSFNNILDVNAGIELAKEFDRPAAVVLKHTNPCGAATADSLRVAYERAYFGDPVSAFGCAVVLNRPLDAGTAEAIARVRAEIGGESAPYFVESLVAPDFEPGALDVLNQMAAWAERTRVLKTGLLDSGSVDEGAKDIRRVIGGLLVQDRDLLGFDSEGIRVVTEIAPTETQLADLAFAWLCCKHVKSNAIVLARDESLVGVGAGQMSRVDATVIAVRKAGERAEGAVLASDAFFPFPDSVEAAASAGVTAVIQPGGSKGDAAVIEAANRQGIAMVLTGARHFRH
ncbi:MAG: bifunctional phosphoribosylaminoimidazolecarboxamide formyltransferase/IMP cyclohydrolase [Planctomycetota bacterium]